MPISNSSTPSVGAHLPTLCWQVIPNRVLLLQTVNISLDLLDIVSRCVFHVSGHCQAPGLVLIGPTSCPCLGLWDLGRYVFAVYRQVVHPLSIVTNSLSSLRSYPES